MSLRKHGFLLCLLLITGQARGTAQEWAAIANPSHREGAKMVMDMSNSRMILFGGRNQERVYDDVWSLNLQPGNDTWEKIFPSGTPPSPRWFPTVVVDEANHRMVIFGGKNGYDHFNDVWVLNLEAGGESWTQLYPSGTPPEPRGDASAIYEPTRQLIVFFGGKGSVNYNDVWVLDLVSLTWHFIAPSGTPPNPRRHHTAIYDAGENRMVIFGGRDDEEFSNDVWALSLEEGSEAWSELYPSGLLPDPIASHVWGYDAALRRIYIFGGYWYEWGFYYPEDSWYLDLNSLEWVRLDPEGEIPVGRRSVAGTYDIANDRLILFGGNRYYDNFFGDTYALSVGEEIAEQFIRGDADSDTEIDILDAIYILRYLFIPGSPEPPCMDAADANDDGEVRFWDAIRILMYRYWPTSPPLPAPCCDYPEDCGPDPTPDGLDCESHPCMGFVGISATVKEYSGRMILEQATMTDGRVILPVHLDNTDYLSAFAYTIKYDPSSLTFKSLNNRDLVTESFDFFSGKVDEAKGELTVGNLVSFDMSQELSPGRYHIADVIFDLTTDYPERDLTFSSVDAELVDTDGNPLTATMGKTVLKGHIPKPLFFALNQNFPNPFRDATHISYAIPRSGSVKLCIYNASGELVRTLVNKEQEPGYYRVQWSGQNKNSERCASGVYFSRIEVRTAGMTEGYTATGKMLLLK